MVGFFRLVFLNFEEEKSHEIEIALTINIFYPYNDNRYFIRPQLHLHHWHPNKCAISSCFMSRMTHKPRTISIHEDKMTLVGD